MADTTGAPRHHRPRPVDVEPGRGLGRAIALLDEIDRTGRGLRPVLRTVERVTGLSTPQVVDLLLAPEPGAAGGASDARRASAEQVEGLRIRIVDTLAASLDDAEVEHLHASLRHLATALERLSARVAAEARDLDGHAPGHRPPKSPASTTPR